MKKSIIVVVFMAFCVSLFAQENTDIEDLYIKKHEAKINTLYLILGGIDVNYEYLINEESSAGLNVFVRFDDAIINNVEYYISPFYRFYFGKKYAAGFFLEGFGMLNSTQRDFNLFFIDEDSDYITDFALGIGLGGKWVTKSGFVGEINFGLGRNLFNTDKTDLDFVSKIGITVGYRF